MKKITLANRVKNYLEDKGNITSWEAIKEFGATRLSAIIYDLRYKKGLNIITKTETNINRYGDKVSYARYYLIKGDK